MGRLRAISARPKLVGFSLSTEEELYPLLMSSRKIGSRNYSVTNACQYL